MYLELKDVTLRLYILRITVCRLYQEQNVEDTESVSVFSRKGGGGAPTLLGPLKELTLVIQ
jgi:hypothetical protein